MKVLLIDDHPLILSALKSTILGLGGGVSVVDVGDALLVALAKRMKSALREGDTLARLGGGDPRHKKSSTPHPCQR